MCHIPAPLRILLMTYSLFVGRADDQTCPESHAADHAEDHLSSCATHTTDIAPEICGQHLSRNTGSPIHGGPFTVLRSASFAKRLWLLPSITFIPAIGPLFAAPAAPLHLFLPHFFHIYTHFISSVVLGSTPLRYPTTTTCYKLSTLPQKIIIIKKVLLRKWETELTLSDQLRAFHIFCKEKK